MNIIIQFQKNFNISVLVFDSTGSFKINAHDIIASYAPWENFYAPGVTALCSMSHAVFVQVTCNMYSLEERIFFVKWYYSTQKNLKEGLHLYREQWPNKSLIIT